MCIYVYVNIAILLTDSTKLHGEPNETDFHRVQS